MPTENDSLSVQRAQTGRRGYVNEGNAVAGSIGGLTRFVDAGPLGPGTYTGYIPVCGNDKCTVINKPTTLNIAGGAVTIAVQPCLADDTTVDPTFAAANLTLGAGVANKDVISGFKGAGVLKVTVSVPASSAIDFTNGLFEYRAV